MTGHIFEAVGYGLLVVAVVGLAAWAAWPHTKPAPAHIGATVQWSPRQETDAAGAGFTPLGLLATEPPAVLDDGTVIGSRGLPSWDALSTDTHHVLDMDPIWRQAHERLDTVVAGVVAELNRPRDIVWWSQLDSTQQWTLPIDVAQR